MKHIKTILHRIEGEENKYVKAELAYDLGGFNVWNYETDRRGYYVLIRRIEKKNGFESFTLFDGRKFLLKEVARQTKKSELECETLFNTEYMGLIKRVYPDLTLSTGCTIM